MLQRINVSSPLRDSVALGLPALEFVFDGLTYELGAAVIAHQGINPRQRFVWQANGRARIAQRRPAHFRGRNRYRFLSQNLHVFAIAY